MSIKKFIIIASILACALLIGLLALDFYSYQTNTSTPNRAAFDNNQGRLSPNNDSQKLSSNTRSNINPSTGSIINPAASTTTPLTQRGTATTNSLRNQGNNTALANRVASTSVSNSAQQRILNQAADTTNKPSSDSAIDRSLNSTDTQADSEPNDVAEGATSENNENSVLENEQSPSDLGSDIDNNTEANTADDSSTETDDVLLQSPGDIAGRVFSNDGKTVASMNLSAVPFDIAAGQSAAARKTLRTRTDEQGNYQFNNVAKAGYRVCTELSKTYSNACIRVLPPQKTADLKVVTLSSAIAVSGVVTNQDNQALGNVAIVSNIANGERTTSKADGSYSLTLKTSNGNDPLMYFSLSNHTEIRRSISSATSIGESGEQQFELNVQLTEKTGFTVTGLVQDTQGNPVSGQNISLRSSSSQIGNQLRYARSNAQGRFAINNVKAADDYYPIVVTNAEYRYRPPEVRPRIAVNGEGTNFTIELEQQDIDYGPLRLFIASSDQQPMSGLSVDLYQNGRRVARSSTLDNGEAYFEKVPSGNVSLTVSALSLRATGLQRNQHDGITLTADTGDNEVRITVVGADNQAIICQQASINWRQTQSGLNVQSSRTVQTDQFGVIYASNFGSGTHTLNLSRCADHRNYSSSLQIGEQVEFQAQLTPLKK